MRILAAALLVAMQASAAAQETVAVQHAATDPGAGLDDRSVLNPLAEITLESLTGFRDRPLFTPARRPPAPPPPLEPEPEPDIAVVEPEPEPEPTVEIPDVTLSGIMEIDSDRVAMLREPSGMSTLSVRVGDPIEAWTVEAIEDSSIVLEYDGRRHEIRMFQPGQPGGSSAEEDSYGEGFIDPETGEFVPDAGMEFDPETGNMRPARGDDAGGRARVAPPKGIRDGAGGPPEPGAEPEGVPGDAAYDAEEDADMPLDAATDGDVMDAADDAYGDDQMDDGSEDIFGEEDLDGDGVPDSDPSQNGG
jgi:hypothetical protein